MLTYEEAIERMAHDFEGLKEHFMNASIAHEDRASGACWALARVYRKSLREVSGDIAALMEY